MYTNDATEGASCKVVGGEQLNLLLRCDRARRLEFGSHCGIVPVCWQIAVVWCSCRWIARDTRSASVLEWK